MNVNVRRMNKMDNDEMNYNKLAKLLTECLEGDRHLAYNLIMSIDKMHQRDELDDAQIRCIVSDVARRQSQ
jgi:hypothetical protein